MFLVGLLFGELLVTRSTLEIVVWHDITSQFAPAVGPPSTIEDTIGRRESNGGGLPHETVETEPARGVPPPRNGTLARRTRLCQTAKKGRNTRQEIMLDRRAKRRLE